MFSAISGDGNSALFSLRCLPDGVYLSDGRSIPVAYDAPISINNGKPVIGVHNRVNDSKCINGAVIGIDVEKRELKLMPEAE